MKNMMSNSCPYCDEPMLHGQPLTSEKDKEPLSPSDLIAKVNASIEMEKQKREKEIMEAKTLGELIRAEIQTPGDFCDKLTRLAKLWTSNGSLESIIRNSHMNECENAKISKENQDLVDAAVVDFINYAGMQYCMDYALYTRDLRPMKVTEIDCCFQCKNVPEWKGIDLQYCYDDGMNSFPHVCSVNRCPVHAGETCNYFVKRN